MKKKNIFLFLLSPLLILSGCMKKNNSPIWMKNAVIYEVNVRQYTKEGTFNAFSDHLPRLKELGVNVLWFMPIYPISEVKRTGSLGSFYSIKDYHDVNSEFGSLDDFKNLVNKAHEMGFKVILDWVGNHTGWDHRWIYDHPDYYLKNSEGQIVFPPDTNWEDVAQLNYKNNNLRKAMINSMKFWIKDVDIDGFRCDYATGVPVDFWEDASKSLNKIKDVYMLAEDNKHYEFLNQAFNSNYGWDLLKIMNDIAKGAQNAYNISSYYDRIQTLYKVDTYPMHFTTNHDENSWNGTVFERLGPSYKAMSLLTFTYPGVPMLYSGQEAGLNKRLKFFEKDEIDWTDLSWQPFFQDLIRLKKENEALYNGKYGGEVRFFSSTSKILAFERQKGNNKVIVIMNLSEKNISTTLNLNDSAGKYLSYFENKEVQLTSNQVFELDRWQYYVFIENNN